MIKINKTGLAIAAAAAAMFATGVCSATSTTKSDEATNIKIAKHDCAGKDKKCKNHCSGKKSVKHKKVIKSKKPSKAKVSTKVSEANTDISAPQSDSE